MKGRLGAVCDGTVRCSAKIEQDVDGVGQIGVGVGSCGL